MPKQKTSASSATRKKHAKRAAGPSNEVQDMPKEKKLKGKAKAMSKAEPKKKIYIPPVRHRAVQPDPLESLGIAYLIPSDLVVILRRLGKKDAVTKTRALEELHSAWVAKAVEGRGDAGVSQNLIDILPVWVRPSSPFLSSKLDEFSAVPPYPDPISPPFPQDSSPSRRNSFIVAPGTFCSRANASVPACYCV